MISSDRSLAEEATNWPPQTGPSFSEREPGLATYEVHQTQRVAISWPAVCSSAWQFHDEKRPDKKLGTCRAICARRELCEGGRSTSSLLRHSHPAIAHLEAIYDPQPFYWQLCLSANSPQKRYPYPVLRRSSQTET